MHEQPEPIQDARLERLLRARAATPMPTGMQERVFRASLAELPSFRQAPAVIARLSFRWLAAAAALLLAAGLAMRWSASTDADDASGISLAVVLEASDDANLGDDLPSLKAMHGARFADLDDEMNMVLGAGRMGH